MRYQPLSSSVKEIRLITIEPNREYTAPIHAGIRSVPLNELPPYTALSYSWGESGKKKRIAIGHSHLRITKSLLQALRRLRNKKISVLWIDQICINQKYEEEKQYQIKLMKLIFRRADVVIAWMGQEDPAGHIAELFKITDESDSWDGAIELGLSKRVDHQVSVLLEREYWIRVWIIQELAMGKEVLVQCGRHQVRWTTLSVVIKGSMFRRRYYEGDLPPQFSCVDALAQMSQRTQQPSLVEAICRTIVSQATVDKDKVYGLIGLVNDADLLVPDIKYTKNYEAEDLCLELTLGIIGAQHRLSVVPLLGRGCDHASVHSGNSVSSGEPIDSVNPRTPRRPSWVPLWHALDGRQLKRQISYLIPGAS
ncbi:hypothetical protein PG988_002153 [Apiospora saccharicola]